ncbi:MAG TPA: hypothetical protein VLW45_03335 [Pelomicrobium sp.]|nr:hypothetical protein [Pelomicrobium sp.]
MDLKMLAAAALAAVVLAGCEGGATVKPTAEPMVGLSSEASAALEQARAEVAATKKKEAALWTTADKALKQAEEAAKKGDNAAVLKNAKIASDHAKLGAMQTKYPLTTY